MGGKERKRGNPSKGGITSARRELAQGRLRLGGGLQSLSQKDLNHRWGKKRF